jgi:hypothetical protein
MVQHEQVLWQCLKYCMLKMDVEQLLRRQRLEHREDILRWWRCDARAADMLASLDQYCVFMNGPFLRASPPPSKVLRAMNLSECATDEGSHAQRSMIRREFHSDVSSS